VRNTLAAALIVVLLSCGGGDDPVGPATGALAVQASGLPAGHAPWFRISGPSGFSDSVSAGATRAGLSPGQYEVAADSVLAEFDLYQPAQPTRAVEVRASSSATQLTHSYQLASGSMRFTAEGLPTGANASVAIAGPQGFTRNVTRTDTLRTLRPGSYSITASNITHGGATYAVAPGSQTLNVPASTTAATAAVTYTLVPGSLNVTITGLPNGVNGAVTVTGPNNFSQSLTATQTLSGLAPGSYTVTASAVSSGGHTYSPTPATRNVTVSSGATASAPVAYAQSTGSLTVTVNGLPAGTNAAITVTGPNAYTTSVTATRTIVGLTPGTYTIAAFPVTSGESYTPSPASQTASVTAASTVSRTVAYSVTVTPTLNLWIDGMHLTQSSQSYAGAVPLVRNRNGFLRVFVRADQSNTAAPQVRVRLYHNSSLQQTYTIAAPAAGVPQTVHQTPLGQSWNVSIPGSLIQPGLRILADVDPGNAVPETDESDNQYPLNGTPLTLEVRNIAEFRTLLVPVHTTATERTGNVTEANKGTYTDFAMNVFPFPAVEVAVRATYTSNAPALESNNANGAWGTILNEIRALRLSEGDSRYYYGVVQTTYGSGIAGMGYLGHPAGIGYDNSSNRGWVAAHEWGHNFGRNHAPCGNPGGPDQNYPYAGGKIGVFGYNLSTSALRDTSMADLMGYCSSRWISDYTYLAVMNFRGTVPLAMAAAQPQPSLLIWGRIRDGVITLEPAFEVHAVPQPPRGGSYRLDVVDGSGNSLQVYSFEPDQLSHDERESQFAFTIPLAAAHRDRIAALRVRGGGALIEARSSAVAYMGEPGETLAAEASGGYVTVTWDAGSHPMAMIRDPRTGEILSFARGGRITLPAAGDELDVHLSDRIRSAPHRIRAERRR
jgi:hypothetical protein